MTNTNVLPTNTWATATLDLEQPYRNTPEGVPLLFPPGYTRAVTLGRQVGVIPHTMYPLRNTGKWTTKEEPTEHQNLSDWGMTTAHELKGGGKGELAHRFDLFCRSFGHGKPEVHVHNYWADEPLVSVSDQRAKWIALMREAKPRTLLVLQSDAPEAITPTVSVKGGNALLDLLTREVLEAGADGKVTVPLAADYGTRMFLVGASRDELPPSMPRTADTVVAGDFEAVLTGDVALPRWGSVLAVGPDPAEPGNRVLRLVPARPGHQNAKLRKFAVPQDGGYELSLRFRIPEAPKQTGREPLISAACGKLRLDVNLERGENRPPRWTVGLHGKVAGEAQTNDLGKPLDAPAADRKWHTLALRHLAGKGTVRLDRRVVFDGALTIEPTGSIVLACGWGFKGELVPCVLVDDVRLIALRPAN